MIQKAAIAALGVMLNACPFGASEKPDGYARVTGQVVMRDGSTYVGSVHFRCGTAPHPESWYFGGDDSADSGGSYAMLLQAPFGSRVMVSAGDPLKFPCRAVAGPRGAPFAVRYVTVPFARDRRAATTTRVDLREGEMEPEP